MQKICSHEADPGRTPRCGRPFLSQPQGPTVGGGTMKPNHSGAAAGTEFHNSPPGAERSLS